MTKEEKMCPLEDIWVDVMVLGVGGGRRRDKIGQDRLGWDARSQWVRRGLEGRPERLGEARV